MMTKQEALLHKLSLRDDFDSFDFEEVFEKESPKKSPLLRFDFIEICGGASKVSRALPLCWWPPELEP